MKNLMTPDEYVKTCIVSSPSLYAGLGITYEKAKNRVFDQLFNVIGNGIMDSEDLWNELSQKNRSNEYSNKYFEQDLWYTYDDKDGRFGVCLDEDKHKHNLINPNRSFLNKPLQANVSRDPNRPWVPYPNFKEAYSLIYTCPVFLTLGEEWKNAAIFYYKEANVFFQEHPGFYHYAFPRIDMDNDRIVADQLEHFGNRTNEEISKDWGYPYMGDVEKFLKGRWLVELDRIRTFIKHTLMILE